MSFHFDRPGNGGETAGRKGNIMDKKQRSAGPMRERGIKRCGKAEAEIVV